MNPTKLSNEDLERGYIKMQCGHVWVFRYDTKYKKSPIAYCDCEGYRKPAIEDKGENKCTMK